MSRAVAIATVVTLLALAVGSLVAQQCGMPPVDEEGPAPMPLVVATKHCALFPHPQLPTENICKLCFDACNQDLYEINLALDVAYDYRNRQNLLAARDEARRLQAVWYATWNTVWPPAEKKYRDEWTMNLIELVGAEAFILGDIPLPLSCR